MQYKSLFANISKIKQWLCMKKNYLKFHPLKFIEIEEKVTFLYI